MCGMKTDIEAWCAGFGLEPWSGFLVGADSSPQLKYLREKIVSGQFANVAAGEIPIFL